MASQPKYENVQLDDHDEAGSTTDVEDSSLMGDEKKWQDQGFEGRPKRAKRSRLLSILQTGRWCLDTVLLLAILGLLVRQQLSTPQTVRLEVGSDFTGVAPKFSQRITKFEMDYKYAPPNASEFFTEKVLQSWNKLMPKGMGFVWVNETERYHDLPTPVEWPDKTVFTTSITHQLHCLFAMAQTYSGLKANHTIPKDHEWHMTHCFSYLRQAIMCSADMALEGHETTFPDHNGGSDGWDSTHVCRDYGQVKSYLESVRAYDDQLIY